MARAALEHVTPTHVEQVSIFADMTDGWRLGETPTGVRQRREPLEKVALQEGGGAEARACFLFFQKWNEGRARTPWLRISLSASGLLSPITCVIAGRSG